MNDPVSTARQFPHLFSREFLNYLPDNVHIYRAFEREARRVLVKGFHHYSARTIVEVLRHHTALTDTTGAYKINDHAVPYLARLFGLMNPGQASLFEFRKAKTVTRERALV